MERGGVYPAPWLRGKLPSHAPSCYLPWAITNTCFPAYFSTSDARRLTDRPGSFGRYSGLPLIIRTSQTRTPIASAAARLATISPSFRSVTIITSFLQKIPPVLRDVEGGKCSPTTTSPNKALGSRSSCVVYFFHKKSVYPNASRGSSV